MPLAGGPQGSHDGASGSGMAVAKDKTTEMWGVGAGWAQLISEGCEQQPSETLPLPDIPAVVWANQSVEQSQQIREHC